MDRHQPDPSHIMQTATAFQDSKVLLPSVQLGLITTLGDERLTPSQLGEGLRLHPRGTDDHFDALVALRILGHAGDALDGKYNDMPQAATSLNKNSFR